MRKARLAGVLMCTALMMSMTGCAHVDWSNPGAPAGRGFQVKQFEFAGQTRNYTVFVPYNYDGKTSIPVIMFLHGVMESGSDGTKCVTVGIGPAASERAATFPFFVVFPQSTSDWQGEDHGKLAIATLDRVLADYPGTDRDRVVLTGLSNGGDGTWSIGAAYADRFAGLVPMCGSGSYDDVPRLTKLPIWVFHNTVDPFRPAWNASGMCEKIKEAGGNVKYTEYGTVGHDCWSKAYSEGEVFQWMLSLRRGAAPAKNGAAGGAKAGTGTP